MALRSHFLFPAALGITKIVPNFKPDGTSAGTVTVFFVKNGIERSKTFPHTRDQYATLEALALSYINSLRI